MSRLLIVFNAAVIALLLLPGCISIESVKDPNFSKKIDKVFVVVKGSDDIQSFLENLCGSIVSDFSRQGIRANYHVFKTLSLESDSVIEEKINRFAPDVVMTIVQTEQSYVNGVKSGAGFTISLYEPASDKPVWKASLETDTSGYAGVGLAGDISRRIIAQMGKDEIIVATS